MRQRIRITHAVIMVHTYIPVFSLKEERGAGYLDPLNSLFSLNYIFRLSDQWLR